VNIRAALICAVTVVTAGIAANPTASADVPTDPAVRGQLAAILSFCASIYPAGDEVYSGLRKLVLGSDQLQDPAEGTSEYRKAFDTVHTALASIPHGQALGTCKAATQGWTSKPAKDDDQRPDKRDNDRRPAKSPRD